jgi:hypothetical protein
MKRRIKMSTRSKLVYLIVALIFVFTSLAGGAFAAVQMAAHDLPGAGTVFNIDGGSGTPAFSIAGDCDMAGGCGSGSG